MHLFPRLGALHIFAEDVDFVEEGTDGGNHILILFSVVEFDIDVKHILHRLSHYRHRFHFGKVNVVVRHYAEDLSEAADLVFEYEVERRLVVFFESAVHRVFYYHKAGVVFLESLDARGDDFEAVVFGGECAAYRAYGFEFALSHLAHTECCVGTFGEFDVWILTEKLSCLVDCHIVAADFFEVFDFDARHYGEVLADAEKDFAADAHFLAPEEVEVCVDGACDGVFDGDEAVVVLAVFDAVEHFLECHLLHDVDVLV